MARYALSLAWQLMSGDEFALALTYCSCDGLGKAMRTAYNGAGQSDG